MIFLPYRPPLLLTQHLVQAASGQSVRFDWNSNAITDTLNQSIKQQKDNNNKTIEQKTDKDKK